MGVNKHYYFSDKLKLLQTPLQRVIAGGFLTAISFVISGSLEFKLESAGVALKTGPGQMVFNVYNGIDPSLGCNLGTFNVKYFDTNDIAAKLDLGPSKPVNFMSDFVDRRKFTIEGKTVTCASKNITFKPTTLELPHLPKV